MDEIGIILTDQFKKGIKIEGINSLWELRAYHGWSQMLPAYTWTGAAAAAQEDLDDFVDEQQSDGRGDADKPLVPA